MDKKFYITTTLPYVNAEPHIGFALEIIQADVIARYHRLLGGEVVFNFGTDEHGLKIYKKALEEGKDPKAYCDEYAKKFDALKKALNLSYTNFIRTTDEYHLKAAQEFWKLCFASGDIYKKAYKQKYCVGCELEKTDSELQDGKCPIHPNLDIEIIKEENYFFRFSKYQKALLNLYKNHPEFVIPSSKQKEINTFVKDGLQDFSISRLKEKMPWGIAVPGDDKQVMYVWFDALINYISTLGWPEDKKNFKDFWPAVQVAGKDNLRQQSAIWQAMLASAGLAFSKQIFIHGFITVNGQKISKSLGNVINPIELVKKYGTDPVRYFLLAKLSPFEDGDFSVEKFEEAYNADLANGLGNLLSRVVTLANKYSEGLVPEIYQDADSHPLRIDTKIHNWKKVWKDVDKYTPLFRFDLALESIWRFISDANKYINENKAWELAEKNQKEFNWVVYGLLDSICQIAWQINPFLPDTSRKIAEVLKIKDLLTSSPDYKNSWTNIKPGISLKKVEPLFPRIIINK
jgi:methionyl-tRNA synthetase